MRRSACRNRLAARQQSLEVRPKSGFRSEKTFDSAQAEAKLPSRRAPKRVRGTMNSSVSGLFGQASRDNRTLWLNRPVSKGCCFNFGFGPLIVWARIMASAAANISPKNQALAGLVNVVKLPFQMAHVPTTWGLLSDRNSPIVGWHLVKTLDLAWLIPPKNEPPLHQRGFFVPRKKVFVWIGRICLTILDYCNIDIATIAAVCVSMPSALMKARFS